MEHSEVHAIGNDMDQLGRNTWQEKAHISRAHDRRVRDRRVHDRRSHDRRSHDRRTHDRRTHDRRTHDSRAPVTTANVTIPYPVARHPDLIDLRTEHAQDPRGQGHYDTGRHHHDD